MKNRISSSKFGIVYSADPRVEDDLNAESLARKRDYFCIDQAWGSSMGTCDPCSCLPETALDIYQSNAAHVPGYNEKD